MPLPRQQESGAPRRGRVAGYISRVEKCEKFRKSVATLCALNKRVRRDNRIYEEASESSLRYTRSAIWRLAACCQAGMSLVSPYRVPRHFTPDTSIDRPMPPCHLPPPGVTLLAPCLTHDAPCW